MSSEFSHVVFLLASSALWAVPSSAADHLTAEQVRAIAASGKADLSGRIMSGDDLTGLDLSGANLAGANLTRANLHGVKLVGTNLTGADLDEADLTFAWIIRTNFTGAHLHGATMQTVVTSTSIDDTPDQAARFIGADLSDASITAHFSYDDMRGANFSHAHMTVNMANPSTRLLRTEFLGASLDGANFAGAGLGHVTFRYARLYGARFNEADLSNADFTGAYLTGADFSGAKLSGTTFESATLTGVKGLDRAATAGSVR